MRNNGWNLYPLGEFDGDVRFNSSLAFYRTAGVLWRLTFFLTWIGYRHGKRILQEGPFPTTKLGRCLLAVSTIGPFVGKTSDFLCRGRFISYLGVFLLVFFLAVCKLYHPVFYCEKFCSTFITR